MQIMIVDVHVHDAVSIIVYTVIVALQIFDVGVDDSMKWKQEKEENRKRERESKEVVGIETKYEIRKYQTSVNFFEV